MLKSLSIRNIVLIEQCELSLGAGLCVLTGETGAGKSILLDALGLVLGQRSETRLIRRGKDQASVAASFDIKSKKINAALSELGIEEEDELRLRRTLSADGKTKCFINDTAVGVAALKSVGDLLVEISGQHGGRGLLNPATHRTLLDDYGEHAVLLSAVGKTYNDWQTRSAALATATQKAEALSREKEYLEHMQKELAALAPAAKEEEALAETRTLMMQSEKLAETLSDVKNELAAGKGAGGMIRSAERILTRSSLSATGRFAAATEALARAGDALDEAEAAIEKLLTDCEYDPAKLENIEERLFGLRGTARKHNIAVEELPTLLDSVNEKLAALKNQQTELSALRKAVDTAKADYRKAADKLSSARLKAAKALEKGVATELTPLKMAATQFKVVMEALTEDRWSAGGLESVRFEAATNKGAALSPLHKIASGGELSRFMLAMKAAMSQVRATPTLIFDEIDTGTGGAVADAVGARLAKLGKTHQVLVVTHLPQVAARGDHHLLVHKAEKGNATFTGVEILTARARREELARMLAGAEVTNEARKAADKLLQAAG